MTIKEKLAHKSRLKVFCIAMLEERIAAARKAMADAQESANAEEKSSAGDKYETSRAMNQIQKDMHAKQLMENLRELSALQSVNVETVYSTVSAGAYIQCKQIAFFIVGGLGKQIVDENTIIFLSPNAPLSLQLKNKIVGDKFLFNREEKLIEAIF